MRNGLVGTVAAGRRAGLTPACSVRLPARIFLDGSAPAEGGMGVHMPTLWDADPGIPKPGGAPVHVRHARLGAAGFNSWIRFSAQNPRQSSLLSKK